MREVGPQGARNPHMPASFRLRPRLPVASYIGIYILEIKARQRRAKQIVEHKQFKLEYFPVPVALDPDFHEYRAVLRNSHAQL